MTEHEDELTPWNDTPMESETFDRGDPRRRCKAKRSDGSGEQCRKWAIRGGRTCATHGSATRAAKNKARERLELAANRMAKELLKMASDENVSESVRLAAIKDALSRAGISEKTAVDVEVSITPFDEIMSGITSVETGSRAEFRRSMGREDDTPPALAESVRAIESADPNTPIDAEFMDLGDELIAAMRSSVYVRSHTPPTTPDGDEHAADERTEPGMSALGGPLGPTGPAASGLLPSAEAVSVMAEMKREAARRHTPPPERTR